MKWHEKRIEEIAEKVAMGPFGSAIRVRTFVPDGVPIISGQHLHGMRVDDSPGFNFITEEHAKRLRTANVERGDVVITHRGTIGQVAYIPKNSIYDRYVISQSQFYVRCDRRQVLPQFVTYYFKTPEGRHKLLANTSQVGVPSIAQPVSYLRSISIPMPPLDVQCAIVRVLEPLDENIELNRHMNDTLEAMVRALFKSWFVDYEPVRAKVDGRSTGLPKQIADLFPDALTGSEVGQCPEGWRVGCVGDVVSAKRQGVDTKVLRACLPYIGLEHMPRGSIAIAEWGSSEEVSSNKFAFSKGELLFGKLRPYFRKAGLAPVSGVCSTDIVVMCPKKIMWSAFALMVISSADFVNYADRTSTGTRMPRTSWKTMKSYPLALPSERVARAFQNVVGPMLERIVANVHGNQKLRGMRDLLLPELVSGVLPVTAK